MLVLTRRISEKLIITANGETIEVAVLGVNGNQVKVGIDAPDHIEIMREELVLRSRREKKAGEIEPK